MLTDIIGSVKTIVAGLLGLVIALIVFRFIYNAISLAVSPGSDGNKKSSVAYALLGIVVLVFISGVIFLITDSIGIDQSSGGNFINQI